MIGALAVYKSRARPYREGEESLLLALSSQLAVAVENARLHERTKDLGEVLEATLDSERRSTRQLRGLYEISASFAESLSLDATLEAVTKTMVQLFDLDAAVIRMPGARGRFWSRRRSTSGSPPCGRPRNACSRSRSPWTRRSRGGSSARAGPSFSSPAWPAAATRTALAEPFLAQGGTRPSSHWRLRVRPWAR